MKTDPSIFKAYDIRGIVPATANRRAVRQDRERRVSGCGVNALARLVLAEALAPRPMSSQPDAPGQSGARSRRGSRRGQQSQVRLLTSVLFGVRWSATDELDRHGASVSTGMVAAGRLVGGHGVTNVPCRSRRIPGPVAREHATGADIVELAGESGW